MEILNQKRQEKPRIYHQSEVKVNGDVVQYIAIAADEAGRTKNVTDLTKRYPLIEWGMTEAQYLAYFYERGAVL